jgi:hypothetical protein
VIGTVQWTAARGLPGGTRLEVNAEIFRALRGRRLRKEAGQRPVGGDDQPGRAMQDGRDQVLLLFGPPSMVVPLIVCVPVKLATLPKAVRDGVAYGRRAGAGRTSGESGICVICPPG